MEASDEYPSGNNRSGEVPQWRRFSAVGTTAYLAPELITGEGHGYASDYWALGVLLFQCLTGKTPFRDKSSVGGTYSNIMYRKVRWPHGAWERMSEEVVDLLARLLEPKVEDRIGGNGPDAAFETLKQHPWFAKHGVDWDKLYDEPGPYVPRLRGTMDVGYFECVLGLSEITLSEAVIEGEEGEGERGKARKRRGKKGSRKGSSSNEDKELTQDGPENSYTNTKHKKTRGRAVGGRKGKKAKSSHGGGSGAKPGSLGQRASVLPGVSGTAGGVPSGAAGTAGSSQFRGPRGLQQKQQAMATSASRSSGGTGTGAGSRSTAAPPVDQWQIGGVIPTSGKSLGSGQSPMTPSGSDGQQPAQRQCTPFEMAAPSSEDSSG